MPRNSAGSTVAAFCSLLQLYAAVANALPALTVIFGMFWCTTCAAALLVLGAKLCKVQPRVAHSILLPTRINT